MAKKNTSKQNTPTTPGKWALLKSFITSERVSYISGLLLLMFTVYMCLAMVSFFLTGAGDQSQIENLTVSEIISNRMAVENWAGVRGAVLSDLFMNRLFGVSSFMIPYFLGSVALVWMRLRRYDLLKRFIFSATVLIWGSWTLAFCFNWCTDDTFLFLGGQHGSYMVGLLKDNIGTLGTALLLLAIFLVVAICTSVKTIPFLQRIFAMGWLGRIHLPKRKKKEKAAAEDPFGLSAQEGEGTASPSVPAVNGSEENIEDENGSIVYVDPEEEEGKPTVLPQSVEEHHEPEPAPMSASTGAASAISRDRSATSSVVASETSGNPPSVIVGPEGEEMEVKIAEEDEEADVSQLGNYDPRLDLSRYVFPGIDLLESYDKGAVEVNMDDLTNNKQLIKKALEDFGIRIASIKATVGPTVTLYEIIPEAGIRIARIKTLEDDIALNLAALQIRIIAPIPGKGTIGIEVPNKNPQTVSMRSVIASKKFQECTYELPVAMGKTITNEVCMFDLAKAPHLLVAGATGQGKSVGLNAIITSLLYKKHPAELKFVMIDPKMVEFSLYSKIERHYLAKLPNIDSPIVTEPRDAVATLSSLVTEMENRYRLLVTANTRNIIEYNGKFINRQLNPEKGHRFMPYIVAIVDEFADLIATSGKEIETPIARIAAKARAVGIHMILATQRPDTKVVTGTIKSNFPSRIAFKVAAMVDSRTILDAPGANRLIGRGDMLLAISGKEMVRVQCAFVDTPEVEHIVNYISEQVAYPSAYVLPEYVPENEEGGSVGKGDVDLSERDPLFEEAARLIVLQQQGSTSLIQRKFAIGYNRAGRLMDQLEVAGVVGPSEGSKARQVLMPDEYSLEQLLNSLK